MGELTFEQQREALRLMSDHSKEWQGIPVPLPGQPLVLHKRHPMRDLYQEIDGYEYRFSFGGPALSDEYREEHVINSWVSHKLNATIHVWKATGKGVPDRYFATRAPRADATRRLYLELKTLGATDAWDVEAEYRARMKLMDMLSDRQWRQYELAGNFIETSRRSGVVYMFRRLRPTVAFSPRGANGKPTPEGESMRILATLCLHPVGYYQESWAGCMVPSDDVIAHLLWMRGDEANFWKNANQHEAWHPEAGL